jgi:hypothetical protein
MRWVVRGSGSVGVFLLDSITRIQSVGSNPVFFALTAGVLAGNMYTGGSLVKQPPYLYQVIVGDGAHRILRTGLPPKTDAAFAGNPTSDSHGPSSEVFESLEVEVCWKSNDCLRPVHPGMDSVGLGARLMGLATWLDEAGQAEVFFPIRHWNRLGNTGKYQVETGPVLWPDLVKLALGETLTAYDFLPAFLHFENEDRVDVSLDYPGFVRSFAGGGSLSRFAQQSCLLKVYEILS